ncbi:acyclic terpene utilization AtuA family protein [Kribbella sp. NPDC055110]
MEFRILAPTGVLGAGFRTESLARGVAARPHVIACDAGSTDSGPAALGSGVPKLSREAVTRDLRHLLRARQELGVPLIIGSCGTSGRDVGVDGYAEIAREIARADGLRFRLARIYSDQDYGYLTKRLAQGRIRPLDPAPLIDDEVLASSHVVGMMGVEPLQAALQAGAEVILAGRASDTALFAALPHLLGADPGLTWHAAKTVECGAACAVPPAADGLLVYLRDDHFDVEVLDPQRRLTARSVAAHTLYENADPFLVTEPSGVLDTEHASYEQISDQVVRVRGAVFRPAETYTVKLEGAALAGYQTIAIGGIRDRVVIGRLDELLTGAQEYFRTKIDDVFDGAVDPGSVDISYRLYGRDAVLGDLEPETAQPHEVGVLVTVTAATQEIAHSVATFVSHVSSHLPIPEYDGLVSTIAYPFSPPEIDRGPVYHFTLNHVVEPDDPTEMFRTRFEEV